MDEYERLKAQKEEMLLRHESSKDKQLKELKLVNEAYIRNAGILSIRNKELETELEQLKANIAGYDATFIRQQQNLSELEAERDYYKSITTSDKRYEEGQMDGHIACRKMADDVIAVLKAERDQLRSLVEGPYINLTNLIEERDKLKAEVNRLKSLLARAALEDE